MKKLYTLLSMAVAAATIVPASAQLSLADRMQLRRHRAELPHTAVTRGSAAVKDAGHTFGFIRLAAGSSRADLEAEGVTVASVRGDIALVSVRAGDEERVASLDCVAEFQLSRPVKTDMDLSRQMSGVESIHNGVDLDHPYTGSGVIAAVVDQGLDANHINFRNSDATSRIGYLGHTYTDPSSEGGWSGVTYDRDNIWRFTTDTDETFHATHTLGIMAGSYNGEAQVAVADNTQTATIQTMANPYYGVATGADIAAGVTDLVDMLIAESIDMILNYRYAQQKPCVLSLSLGSNVNSHNPNSLMGQFLELVAKEAVVVLSAGNEGDIPLALVKTLGEGDTEAKTFIMPSYAPDTRYGMTYVYSDRPFTLKAVIFNRARGKISYNMGIPSGLEDGAGVFYCSSDYKQETTDVVSSNFSNAFSGYVGVGYNREQYTGEYTGLVSYYTKDNPDKNANGNYILGFVVEGEPGQRIECYNEADYGYLDSFGIEGWDTGQTDGTISDMACGKDVLVVGAYNVRDSYGALDGYVYGYQNTFLPGKITPFSSYGTLADGRTLPHVCAPGAAVISSTSSYYAKNEIASIGKRGVVASVSEVDRENYWAPASGTSMSTPYVAGSIALWLEADPTLTINEIKEIVATTSIRDEEVLSGNPVQWGAGKFDAYAGLKEVIRRSGIGEVSADADGLMVKQTPDGRIELFVGNAASVGATVYDLTGVAVSRGAADGDTLTMDLSDLRPGVYVVTVNGTHSKKIVIR